MSVSVRCVVALAVCVSSVLALPRAAHGSAADLADALGSFKRDNAAACSYKGSVYAIGASWRDADTCEDCQCQVGGQPRCVDVKCAVPLCVNFGRAAGECCDTCPGAKNCKYGDIIIAANPVYVVPMGNCKKFCRCPGESTYAKDGMNTQAICEMVCIQS